VKLLRPADRISSARRFVSGSSTDRRTLVSSSIWLSCAVHSLSCEQLTAQQKVTRMRIEIEFAGCAYEQDCGTMRALETFGKTGQFAARPASNLTVDALIQ
jgi:hypothetical protein